MDTVGLGVPVWIPIACVFGLVVVVIMLLRKFNHDDELIMQTQSPKERVRSFDVHNTVSTEIVAVISASIAATEHRNVRVTRIRYLDPSVQAGVWQDVSRMQQLTGRTKLK